MKLSASATQLIITLLFFGIPLGLGNALAQPTALLLLTPTLLLTFKKAHKAIPVITLVSLSSIYNIIAYPNLEHSLYQFARSGVPFLYLCIFLASYKHLEASIEIITDRINAKNPSTLDKIILAYSFGQFTQAALYKAGIDIANAASKTETLDRVLLFPSTSTIILFLYACISRNHILICVTGAVLLATGSKAVLIAMLAMFVISALNSVSTKSLASYASAAILLMSMIFIANPLAIERLNNFLHKEEGVDITRQYEIYHAKQSFLSGPDTVLFGNGLTKPITPGVPTNDPKWFENSKFDIENGYWSLIAKLGILGVMAFIAILASLPRNTITLALFLIWALFSFKTSYQFFTTFDGCYLVLWAAVLTALLRNKEKRKLTTKSTANPYSYQV